MSAASRHVGRLLSGTVTCTCGWESQHHALGRDAAEEYDDHVAEVEQESLLDVPAQVQATADALYHAQTFVNGSPAQCRVIRDEFFPQVERLREAIDHYMDGKVRDSRPRFESGNPL